MMRFTQKELATLLLAAVFGGVILGYTLGLIQQASWKAKQYELAQMEAGK